MTAEESEQLISLFALHRSQLLAEIDKAGREPEAHCGGYLSTSEIGFAPYPKVYDMNGMITEIKQYLDSDYGLVVAHAHGPKNFVMRYEEPSVEGFETLNDNPWIDFTAATPQLLPVARF